MLDKGVALKAGSKVMRPQACGGSEDPEHISINNDETRAYS